MNVLNDIKQHISKANAIEKIIYINIAIYIIVLLFKSFMIHEFSLSSNLSEFGKKPWTIVSYAFIHTRIFHILSNLVILFYIGNLFINFFSEKKAIIYYTLGLLVGGISFLAYNSISKDSETELLIGASAAVTAIFIGVASKIPRYALQLRFIGSIELWVLAAIWIALSVFGTAGINAGGAVAHLGGAFMGYLLTIHLGEGDFLSRIFTKKVRSKTKPFQKVYRNTPPPQTKPSYSKKKQNQRKVDAILDKISKSGYDALTKEEKDFLFNQKDES